MDDRECKYDWLDLLDFQKFQVDKNSSKCNY